jgi:hypothetical protein
MARTVVIELTSRQLSDVLRQSAEVHSVAAVISGLSIPMSTRLALSQASAHHSTSRSLLLGLIVLAAFPATGETRRLSEVAKELEMSPSTAHRYLHTLITLGLIERGEDNRRYRRTSIPSAPSSE